ncbi:MAG: aminoacyl-tRNA hydrolase [Candidatus Pacebacteria bacterium]|nr:aminoacyl-tRNA hydrolase [Candidatus Paceibacterota bacterium]MBP9840400.1 aminoacyl-tRNA hydrolase [Candidatus Paceibacterota bacterium]
MAIVMVGLGNPGNEYEKTRHNAGRMALITLAKAEGFEDFALNKKSEALVTAGEIGGEKVTLVLPETFMNKSGKSVMHFIKSVKAAKTLVIVRDDLDLPLGVTKMTFARGAGGHKGVESIMRAIKTDAFAQLKIGISGKGKKNQAKKVSGEEKVLNHVIGKFKPADEAELKKVMKKCVEALRLYATDGIEKATMFANTR